MRPANHTAIYVFHCNVTRARCRGLPVDRVAVAVARARFLAARARFVAARDWTFPPARHARLGKALRERREGKPRRGDTFAPSEIRKALPILKVGVYVSMYNHYPKFVSYFMCEGFTPPNTNINEGTQAYFTR